METSIITSRIRSLAAIDIALLGYKLIYAEYLVGVVLGLSFGFFVLGRSQSMWHRALGVYLVCLGANYVPMLIYTIAIGSRQNAQAEIADELAESGQQRTMSRYRKVSLFLLVPLMAPVLAVIYEVRRSRSIDR
ncbi:MAG: hypothetical protein EPN47_03920 [Acidobacteria bacterium]|nr:MAG: hypothetical protein EPN47_03920 [Acidobacteriota bacterium]